MRTRALILILLIALVGTAASAQSTTGTDEPQHLCADLGFAEPVYNRSNQFFMPRRDLGRKVQIEVEGLEQGMHRAAQDHRDTTVHGRRGLRGLSLLRGSELEPAMCLLRGRPDKR